MSEKDGVSPFRRREQDAPLFLCRQGGMRPNQTARECAIDRLGPYRIVAECGRGGMSVVYSAMHESLKTRHAIKVFDVSGCDNVAVLRGKFLAEARILATLRHPNIVRVTDYGTAPDGRPWLAMDFIDGKSLAARLAESSPPTPDEAIAIYRDIRDALAYCHSLGIVHGDLKAENILLRGDGHAVLSDFGIARIISSQMRKRLDLTTSCEMGGFGTAYALAPECRDGASATPCSDVYSFGVAMFKVVTGIWYEGSPRLMGELSTFAPSWERTLSRMLALDPSKRPVSAMALSADPVEPVSGINARRVALVVTAIVVSCLGCGVAAAAYFTHVTPPHRQRGGREPQMQLIESCSSITLRAGRIAMRPPVHIGRLSLPDVDDLVVVEIPNDFSGVLLSADEVDGDIRNQIRIAPQSGMRVLYRNDNSIAIKRQ